MRLLFIADGRSPIALNWISHFVESGHEVHLVSTFPCQQKLDLVSLEVIPVAFASAAGGGTPSSSMPGPTSETGISPTGPPRAARREPTYS